MGTTAHEFRTLRTAFTFPPQFRASSLFLCLFRCVLASLKKGLSVRPSVGRLVGRSVMLSSNSLKNGFLRILNDLDIAGRGTKKDKEERMTRRKDGLGGRRDEEEGATRRKERQGGRSDEREEVTRRQKQ